MKRLIFFSASFLLVFLFVVNRGLFRLPERLPGNPQPLAEAARLYQAGGYEKAAAIYQEWIDLGAVDAGLFYNLGNAYYKQGDIGRAILNYRRAQSLAPRDADLQVNLALARSQTKDRIEGEDEDLGMRLAQISHYFSQDELALAVLVLWFLFVILFMAYRAARLGSLWREALLYGWIAMAILALLIGGILGSRLVEQTTRREGVILAGQADVTSAPGGGNVQFVLHAGAEIDIMEVQTGWMKVSLPGGNLQGWLPAEAAETLYPKSRSVR